MYEERGLRQFAAIPCTFYLPELDVVFLHHGDDFLTEGTEAGLEVIDEILTKRFGEACKRQGEVGPDSSDEFRFLNKFTFWCDKGFAVVPDPRHTQTLLAVLGLTGAKPAPSPGTKDTGRAARNALDELSDEDASTYRTAVGICQYIAGDRPDIQFETKEAARNVQKPRVTDLMAMKRLARYLAGSVDTGLLFRVPDEADDYRLLRRQRLGWRPRAAQEHKLY
jgi:hypothetical protein